MKYQDNDFDEFDEMLFKYFKENKEVPQKTQNIIKNMNYNGKRNNFGIRKIAITILAITTLTTGGVFAQNIVSFFKNIFSLSSININNDSVVDAIEKENYIQNVNMNYVTINKDYKIKVDYVMVDDINLYIVFSLCSAKSMDENYRMAVNYLDIKDENQNVIYSYTDENEVKTVKGSKKINCTDNKEKKELVFIYSKEHPKMKQLNVSFNRIILYDEKNPEKNVIRIDCDCDFKIDIAEKFVNRENIEFYNFENTDDIEIKKCIVNDTGMYIILNAKEYINSKQIYIGEKSYEGTEIIIDSNDKQDECILQFDITKNKIDKNKSIRLEINDKILKIEE